MDAAFPGPAPSEAVTVLLQNRADPDRRKACLTRLTALLSGMNWRCHVYLLGEGPADSILATESFLHAASDYLAGQPLTILHVHPFLKITGADREAEAWQRLVDRVKPFQAEAWKQQGEARLVLLPILEPLGSVSDEAALSAATFFDARLARPSLFFRGRPAPAPERVAGRDIRIYVDPETDSGLEGTMTQVWFNHVFDDVLERVDQGREDLLDPCRAHRILEEETGTLHDCFSTWKNGLTTNSFPCHACIPHACAAMAVNLRANDKVDEGRQVFLDLAMTLSGRGDHGRAGSFARMAFEFSSCDADRTAALLHEGLCNLSAGNLEKAAEILTQGKGLAPDPGVFAYHLGRVEFTWRDYIKAVDWFEEALSARPADVPEEDLLFNLALSHINLQEYKEARPYLDLMDLLEHRTAPMRLSQGICDLGEGRVESALEKFNAALEAGPTPEDLSRVLFYIGTAQKELGRFDEAIETLVKAVEADPEDLANHNLLGFCYYKTGRHEEAVKCFRRAIEIDPRSGIDHANLASNLRDLGRIDEAIPLYEKALNLDPTLGFARTNLKKLRKEGCSGPGTFGNA